jgi:hypothetical protein
MRAQRAIFLLYDHSKHVFSMHFDSKSNLQCSPQMSHNHVQLPSTLHDTAYTHTHIVRAKHAHRKTRQTATPDFQDKWPRPPCITCVSNQCGGRARTWQYRSGCAPSRGARAARGSPRHRSPCRTPCHPSPCRSPRRCWPRRAPHAVTLAPLLQLHTDHRAPLAVRPLAAPAARRHKIITMPRGPPELGLAGAARGRRQVARSRRSPGRMCWGR